MMYEAFAGVYDALMAQVDYRGWADYYLALCERSGVTVRRAADAACGTGSLTVELAARGVTMTGLDLSMDMLRVASEKARKQGMQIPFVRQDMRRMLLHRPMDAVFCACDGVNYLTRLSDVKAFLEAAYRALRPGGGLFFDVSTRRKLEERLGNNCLGDDGETVSYLWQNHYHAPSRTLQMDLTLFVRQADGRYARFLETHFQRAHEEEELASLLEEAGFAHIRAYGDRTFSPPSQKDERMHMAAVRAE